MSVANYETIEELQALDYEEAESQIRQNHEAIFDAGREQGYAEGKQAGYEEGYKKGYHEAHYDANIIAYWALLQKEKRT